MGLMKQLSSEGSLIGRGRSGSRRTFFETEWFFDKRQVALATDKATRRILSRIGSFIRRDARQSIKNPVNKKLGELSDRQKLARKIAKRDGEKFTMPKARSKPGQPPRNQTGLLKSTIFFFFNPDKQFVDIGPARLRGIMGENNMEALEFGGVIRTKNRTIPVKARPFMQPALDKNLPLLPLMWSGAIR